MYVKVIIFLIISSEISGTRRQFNHYHEFLAKQKEEQKAALRFGVYKQSEIQNFMAKTDTKIGPTKGPDYYPNYGYEPYWKWGDWVFNRTRVTNGTLCGTECLDIFIKYGPVCAVSYRNYYKSFDNICAVRSHDCYDRGIWRVIHRGPCREEPKLYPYATNVFYWHTVIPRDRAGSIIDAYVSRAPGDEYWISRRKSRKLPAKNISRLHKKFR